MADGSRIEWTDATWNPVTGCSVVSAGCTNCYAMRLAGTRLRHHPSRAGLTRPTKAGPVWTAEVRLNEGWLTQPLRWKRPRRIFVCAHGDLFAEGVPDDWIDKVFAVMALAPWHTFQVLTKRPERARGYLTSGRAQAVYEIACDMVVVDRASDVVLVAPGIDASRAPKGPRVHLGQWPLPNVWLGTSIEDQRSADARVPELLAARAAVRFVSAEPLLGPVDLRPWTYDWGCGCGWGGDHPLDYCNECGWRGEAANGDGDPCPSCGRPLADYMACPRCDGHSSDGMSFGPNATFLDWVIVGGESGSGARPMHPDWVRALRDQCVAAGVPFFFKQWGEWIDADLLLDRWVGDGWEPMVDGVTWSPARPLNFYDAERLGCGLLGRPIDDLRPYSDGRTFVRMGKKAAGRLLDGVVHDAMPGGSAPHPGAARHPSPSGGEGVAGAGGGMGDLFG